MKETRPMMVTPKSFATAWRAICALFLFALATACVPISTGPGGPKIDPDKPVRVALLVPSGSGSAGDDMLAKGLENAARLAISDLQGSKIDLAVYSTAGKTDRAAAMALQAANDGAKIIIGPVYAQNANAAGVAVAKKGLRVLTFSNNTAIAGGNVYVMGASYQNTAERMTAFATRQGKKRLVIVHANTVSGNSGKDAIIKAAANNNISIVGSAGYEFSQQGVVTASAKISALVKSTKADGIFFTSDTAGALPLFSQLLTEQGVNPAAVQFMGLPRWDIPQSTLELPGVQNGWFALPDPSMTSRFVGRYQSTYGDAPHPIAGLAYDAIAAIGALLKQGTNTPFSNENLTQSAGFAGVNGAFRLRTDGTSQRALSVAQIQNNQVVIVAPAPKSFGLLK